MYRDIRDMLGVGFQEIMVLLWSRDEGSNVLERIKVTPTSASVLRAYGECHVLLAWGIPILIRGTDLARSLTPKPFFDWSSTSQAV